MSTQSIEKTLSANDTGETGGHQAGILVPKNIQILDFFPKLNPDIKNPRAIFDVVDETGTEWTFNYIYYNNKFFGGTRNEFRLTGMTAYFRKFNLKVGDVVIFKRVSPRQLTVSYRRLIVKSLVLKLTGTWKIIDTD